MVTIKLIGINIFHWQYGRGGGGGYIYGTSRGERVGATSDKQAQLEVPHLKMQVGLDLLFNWDGGDIAHTLLMGGTIGFGTLHNVARKSIAVGWGGGPS